MPDALNGVELRVHGVSGTPPESLLGVPQVEQVAGDEYSRFFRPAGAADDGHVLEGYHWGRFTSGTWRQGLALLLVPFGLVNAAQFMLPRPRKGVDELLFLLAGLCLRLLALVLTALFSFTLGLVLIDIVAWRWAPDTALDERLPFWLIVLLGAFAAVLCVAGLAVLGRTGRTRLPPDSGSPEAHEHTALDPEFFAGEPNAPTMRKLHLSAGLGVIALMLALTRQPDATPGLPLLFLGVTALVVALAGDPERTVTVGRTIGKDSPWDTARPVVASLLLVLSAALLIREGWLTGDRLSGTTPSGDLIGFNHVANGLMLSAVVVLGTLHTANLFLVWRGSGLERWTRSDATLRLRLLVAPLLVAVLILLVDDAPPALTLGAAGVAAVTVGFGLVALRRAVAAEEPEPPPAEFYFRPFAGGMTPFLLATLSTFLGVGLSAAAANAVAAALPAAEGTTPGTEVATTKMLDRVGYAWGATAIELLILALLALAMRWCVSRHFRAHVAADYAVRDGVETELPEDWRPRVAKAMAMAQGKNLLPAVVIFFVAFGLLITGVQVFETYPGLGSVAWWLDAASQPREAAGASAIVSIGTWLLVGVAGYLVAVSRGAIRNQNLRRAINVVWDVFSFWPHAVHPFVPRPYSRWTVIELRNRIRRHLRDPRAAPGRHVVVAAHSQGSLIAYAALLMLKPEELKRVAFLSCGSQLRVIYPRAFPAYVNLATHRELFGALDGAWINLYRLTDALAGPVLSWDHATRTSRHFPDSSGPAEEDDFVGADRCRRCGNDWRLIDPIPYDKDVETGAVSKLHGHSDFWGDPSWARALAELRRSLTP